MKFILSDFHRLVLPSYWDNLQNRLTRVLYKLDLPERTQSRFLFKEISTSLPALTKTQKLITINKSQDSRIYRDSKYIIHQI